MNIGISNPMNYHVVLYIRLSKEDESEGPSQSVTNQKSLLDEFVKRNCLTVFDIYIDDGWSGTNFNRPDFQRMIRDIELKKVNMVVTKDLSRLGRDYILTGHYMEKYFPEHRVRYISLLDGIDTGVESSANDITPFRAIMNDMYAKDISKKITSVKRDKQKKGEFIGGKPYYGYKMHPTEKNKIIVDENVAYIVKRIFNYALSGMSCRQIAIKLNEDHIPTPAKYCGWETSIKGPYTGMWSSERISDMLQNEVYIGNMVQGKSKKVNYKSSKSIKVPRENWIIVEGTHEPLVDKETFHKVQLLINSRKHTRRRTYDFLLKGLIFCHECGYPLAVINRKNAAGHTVLYFICRTYQRFTKSGVCTCHSIKEETVNNLVIAKIREVCETYLDMEKFKSISREVLSKNSIGESSEKEIKSLEAKISELTDKLDKIYLDKLNGILLEEDFQRIYKRIKEESKVLEERRDSLNCQVAKPKDTEKEINSLVNKFMSSSFASREVLVGLVERIELTADRNIIIKFRFSSLNKSET